MTAFARHCGSCMRGIDGKLCLIMKERCTLLKDFVERLVNEENVWVKL